MASGPNAPEVRSRRRGAVLERSLYQAALDELIATGYAGLTMEGVARRARTGKAALYRRWASKRELVLDALQQALPDLREIVLSGSVREDLLAVLSVMADALGGRTGYPGIDVLIDMLREPELREAFATRVIGRRLLLLEDILRRGVDRGEVDAGSVTRLVAMTGPALVLQTFLLTGGPPSGAELARIVDTILMPLLAGPRNT